MSDEIEFQAWPKTPRLFRDIVITEKIDGTNAAIHIRPAPRPWSGTPWTFEHDGDLYAVVAQSRKRLIDPTLDNYGFAAWVRENAQDLIATLGCGTHYGEWWGQGIQRNYGLTEKRFSLFNTSKWADADLRAVPQLNVVPVLYGGAFRTHEIDFALQDLRRNGSVAAPGFPNPEGVVVFHTAANSCFKVTLKNDEQPKGQVQS